MKSIEHWTLEDYKRGYESLLEISAKTETQNSRLRAQAKISKLEGDRDVKFSRSSFLLGGAIGCFVGCLILGFLVAVHFEGHAIPVEGKDRENNRILIKCEDQTTEWAPRPVCEKATKVDPTKGTKS